MRSKAATARGSCQGHPEREARAHAPLDQSGFVCLSALRDNPPLRKGRFFEGTREECVRRGCDERPRGVQFSCEVIGWNDLLARGRVDSLEV